MEYFGINRARVWLQYMWNIFVDIFFIFLNIFWINMMYFEINRVGCGAGGWNRETVASSIFRLIFHCRAGCTYIARQFSLIRNKQKQETLFPLFRSTQQQQYVINQSILPKTNEFCYILWYSNATHFKVIYIGPCCLWMLTLVTKGSEYLH